MEPTTLEQVARMVAQFGAIGLGVGVLNIVALRLVRLEEVPGPMRGRIRWWTLHNPAFLAVSGLVLVAGLAMLVAA
jgi:hypothetical protein